jgi:hypothetical protein
MPEGPAVSATRRPASKADAVVRFLATRARQEQEQGISVAKHTDLARLDDQDRVRLTECHNTEPSGAPVKANQAHLELRAVELHVLESPTAGHGSAQPLVTGAQ